MTGYVHHVSGRLRLKLARLKGNPERARETEMVIRRIHGVQSVETNVVTGSLLIYYGTAGDETDIFLDSLKKTLHLLGWTNVADRQFEAGDSAKVSGLADRMVGALVEKVLERSAVAIVGALL